MKKVNRRPSGGVQSLGSLIQTLREAAILSGGEVTSAAPTTDEWGVSFTSGNGLYWAGLNYSESEILLFRACGVNKDGAPDIGFGSVQVLAQSQEDSRARSNRLDLESERVRFFAQTKSNQFECLEHFLMDSLKASTPALGNVAKSA